MKRLLFVLFLFIPFALFGQDVLPDPPTGWGDIIINPAKWFVDLGAVSVLTAFIATFFIGLLRMTSGFLKQLTAWLVAIALIVITDLLNFGYAADLPLLLAVIHGFAAGLAANGIFDIPILKSLLKIIEGWLKPKPA